jgi:hypothetical protein
LQASPSQQEAATRHTLAANPFQPILNALAVLERDDPKFAFPADRLVGLYRRIWESYMSKHIDGQKLEQSSHILEEAGTHLRKERDLLQQSVSYVPHPYTNVTYEAACNSYRNSFFDEKSRVMVFMDLFKIQTDGQRYIAYLLTLSLQIVVDNICFLSCAVFSHSQTSGPVNDEWISCLSILRWRRSQRSN